MAGKLVKLARFSIAMGLTLGLLTIGLAGGGGADAAGPKQGQISFQFTNVNFSSILGGQISGQAKLQGPLAGDGSISRLDGDLNLPLKDRKLMANATGPTQRQTLTSNQQWIEYVCNPFCTPVVRNYTVTTRTANVPLKIKFSGMDGNGTLAWSSSTCSGECPPWGFSGGSATLNGAVVGSRDGGTFWMSGPAPSVQ